uniref:Aldehyde dehydrogenase 16 family, member A1 n=1 Tax=Xiphophorus couchianus TaxID=32473 RepID=A0A3B5MLY7_9TELE
MADSTNPTVYEIFQSMEQGPAAATSTATAQAWLDHHSRSLGFFMDGKFILPADRRSLSLTDSKGGVVCSTACAEDADVSQCASSAAAGWTSWSSLSCSQRAKALLRLVGVLGLHGQCVSELCEASCSPAALVRLLQYYSGWAQLRDTLIPGWTPVGVVVVVSSDDCSLYSLMLRVLPALAMGNSVIVVPGRSAAPPALLLAQLFTAAGLPAGTLNILTGSDVTLGAKVSRNPDVRLIAYCGNKQDGLALCKASAGMGVPVSVSSCVGATCPFIIFESADIDSAVDEVIQIAFKKKNELHWVLCVQESVSDSVVARLKLRMADMKSVPLSSDADRVLVDAAVQEALQQGATVIPISQATGMQQNGPLCESKTPPPDQFHKSGRCQETLRGVANLRIIPTLLPSFSWMKKSPSARAQSLYSLAKGLESRRKEVCASVGAQLGVPAEEADREVELSIGRLNVWAAYCDKVQGGSPPMTQSGAALSFPEPLGVVGIVLPDDAPLLSLVTVLGAAIATGNAVVMVPSQRFPLPALAFVQVLQSSDLPAGLVNIITGNRDQLTVALANHSVIKAIWYWGSAQGCQYLQHTCTSPLKTLRLSWQQAGEGCGAAPDWAQPPPSLLEDLWRNAVQWKSVWIPTA